METLNLRGLGAIVTGGGTGIGRGIALALGAEGVKVVICGRRPAPLDAVAAEIQKAGGEAVAIPADVSDAAEVGRLVSTAEAAHGYTDILVNNAGVGARGYFHELSVEDWDRIMAINLRGPFLMARSVLPQMRRRKRGHIINISSESGLEYYPGGGGYGVAKHALNALGELIQRENQALGIRVDTICPGMVVTPMSEESPGLRKEKCLYPEDVADLALWLLTRRPNVKIGRPLLIQTMENPWK